jgi:mannose-6-phosphate isomerase-like protein (cupin superfamily)
MKIAPEDALLALKKSNKLFNEIFRRDTLSVEIYKPDRVDLQNPHDQDELYIIIAGSGDFLYEEEVIPFKAGDFLFVPAGVVHRFQNFTNDFSTWVIFFGPKVTI